MQHIYNSLTRKKEVFIPIEEGKIGLYVCGMTVYDFCHLGHARMLVVFDIVVRYMRASGYDVNYIRNITDIDDKIIERANQNNEQFDVLTNRFIKAMHEDLKLLNILAPTQEPRATAHINEIISMIETLIEKGYAYQAEKGDVYYRVRKFETYGTLSGKNIDDLRVGARVAEDTDKEDPLDFVLWKQVKPDEPFWPSPWGDGRPGWHIECSAMSKKCIGDHFDIHAGGVDLQFPHHENEIAQSEAATSCTFVNYWMHNGHVRVDDEKMSKSLGNFFTLRDIFAQDSQPKRMAEVVRFMFLGSHYRSPLNYSGAGLETARAGLDRVYKIVQRINEHDLAITPIDEANAWQVRFKQAMDDDFNTPEALAVIFELGRETNKQFDEGFVDAQSCAIFTHMCETLGIAYQDPEKYLGLTFADGNEVIAGDLTAAQIDGLLQQRSDSKKTKNWARADEIRDQLTALGISIEDKPNGCFSWSSKH